MNIGDFNNLPFCVPDSAEIIELRKNLLGLVRSDDDLQQIVYAALSAGHEQWLIATVRHDLAASNAGEIARGLTIAGMLDATDNADRLWREEIEPTAFTGWLAAVRDDARGRYQKNIDARLWFDRFLKSRDADEAFAYMRLFEDTLDFRQGLWAQDIVNAERDKLPIAWLRHIDATGENRSGSRKQREEDRKKVLFSTRTVNGIAPWL